MTAGYQIAFLLAAVSVAAGLIVVLFALRPAGGGHQDREPALAEFSEAEAEAA